MRETMSSRERVLSVLEFEQPDRIPRDLVVLPPVLMTRPSQVEATRAKFPLDIELPEFEYGPSLQRGSRNMVGVYYDEWGCPFSVAQAGMKGEVKDPPLADWANLKDLVVPEDFLLMADLHGVDLQTTITNRFVLAKTKVRPFERLQFLRGTVNVFLDLARKEPLLAELLAIVHRHNLKEIELWANTEVDAVFFQDDWGSQTNLLISPEHWRSMFKPLYQAYVEIIHGSGKYVFFHSDGNITSLIPDLIEIGVDALNSQLFCMDIEALADVCEGKITIWGEIDRQRILPFGNEMEVRQAVRRVRRAFDKGHGGLIAWLEWNDDVSQANIEAAFAEWQRQSIPGTDFSGQSK